MGYYWATQGPHSEPHDPDADWVACCPCCQARALLQALQMLTPAARCCLGSAGWVLVVITAVSCQPWQMCLMGRA